MQVRISKKYLDFKTFKNKETVKHLSRYGIGSIGAAKW